MKKLRHGAVSPVRNCFAGAECIEIVRLKFELLFAMLRTQRITVWYLSRRCSFAFGVTTCTVMSRKLRKKSLPVCTCQVDYRALRPRPKKEIQIAIFIRFSEVPLSGTSGEVIKFQLFTSVFHTGGHDFVLFLLVPLVI